MQFMKKKLNIVCKKQCKKATKKIPPAQGKIGRNGLMILATAKSRSGKNMNVLYV